MLEVTDLPKLNAALNATCTGLLVWGYAMIRSRPPRVVAHKRLMLAAFFVSAAFLASYLVYHALHGSTRFTHPGWPRRVYLAILLPHIALAAVQVPLILVTLYRALRGQLERHRRIARWTIWIWLYVSVTGVLVYLMLYVWYPPGAA